MSTLNVIVAICAGIGALLGVINLVRNYLADAERLRVAVWNGDTDGRPRIEIVNVSPFTVSVMAIGRVYSDGQVVDAGIQKMPEEEPLPARIGARESRVFPVSLRETIAEKLYKPKYTFVKTALGGVFTDERRATHWWRRAKERLHLKARDFDQ